MDSPKRKPNSGASTPLPSPKKFVPFSFGDSQSIEAAFQAFYDPDNESRKTTPVGEEPFGTADDHPPLVPVNEDYLFDVDIEQRELRPAYWIGPAYEVRRGTWFIQEGSTFKPCEENLATQLEEGFLKARPWRLEYTQETQIRPGHVTTKSNERNEPSHSSDANIDSGTPSPSPSSPPDNARLHETAAEARPSSAGDLQSQRLFGTYMNSIVTYHDASTAWLTADDFMSRVSTTVYQKFGGVAGTKVTRGFNEAKKAKEPVDATKDTADRRRSDRRTTSPSSHYTNRETSADVEQKPASSPSIQQDSRDRLRKSQDVEDDGPPRTTLERQMSSLAGEPQNMADLEEQARKQEEQEMEDSREIDGEDRERQIDHLVLVTHGIGQRLGLRIESVNFVHDVNCLRKTLKSVYKASPGLQALNSSFADSKKNCRVQVLPV